MDGTFYSQQQKSNSASQHTRKRKRTHKGVDSLAERQSYTNMYIDKLPDDILTGIVSRMSLKEAVRTSVLSCRWRYIWMFTSGILEFDDTHTATGIKIKRKKFKSWVNHVLKLHQCRGVDGLVIRFTNLRLRARSSDIDSWIDSAIHKNVKRFELNLSVENGFHCSYKFPNIEKLLSRSHEFKIKSIFGSLRCLRLVAVDIDDDVVHYFLASCPYIEQLCIRDSDATQNLEIVGPLPNLKELEISDCCNLQSMSISAMNLVSSTYQGNRINSPFKKTPNLSELTLGRWFCKSFIFEPTKHSSYSSQLVKLVLNFKSVSRERPIYSPDLPRLYSLKSLELNTVSRPGRSLLFFTSLIKASPNLQEFRIKIQYLTLTHLASGDRTQYPIVTLANAGGFHHKNLKRFEMAGFCGFPSEEELFVLLSEVAVFLELISVDTQSDYHLDRPLSTRGEEKLEYMAAFSREGAIKDAIKLKPRFPSEAKFVVT